MAGVYLIAKASLVEINTVKINLKGEKIVITQYNLKTYMLLQRYYDIGKDVIQPYDNVSFTCSNHFFVPFTSTSELP